MTNSVLWGSVAFVQVGEDVEMGDYLVLGKDGRLYKMSPENDKCPKIGRARTAAKEGTNTLITLPIIFEGE